MPTTLRLRGRPRPGLLLPTVLAMSGLLTACASGPVPPGVAGTAGQDVVTVAELQAEVRELAEVAPEVVDPDGDVAGVQSTVLSRQLIGLVIDAVAEDNGVSVAPAAVDSFVDEVSAQAGGLDAVLSQNLLTEDSLDVAARQTLLVAELERLGLDVQAEVEAKSDQLDVTVNPRYGSWEQLAVVPGTGGIALASG